jgi:hypothetical protein
MIKSTTQEIEKPSVNTRPTIPEDSRDVMDGLISSLKTAENLVRRHKSDKRKTRFVVVKQKTAEEAQAQVDNLLAELTAMYQ